MIKIEGTQVRKQGGHGLGSLLGKILGVGAGLVAAPFTGGTSLAAGLAGAGIGGSLGGAVGEKVNPANSVELGVPIAGQRESGTPMQQQGPGAIERLNSALDLGGNIAGGIGAFSAPKPIAPKLIATNAFSRRLGGYV